MTQKPCNRLIVKKLKNGKYQSDCQYVTEKLSVCDRKTDSLSISY